MRVGGRDDRPFFFSSRIVAEGWPPPGGGKAQIGK